MEMHSAPASVVPQISCTRARGADQLVESLAVESPRDTVKYVENRIPLILAQLDEVMASCNSPITDMETLGKIYRAQKERVDLLMKKLDAQQIMRAKIPHLTVPLEMIEVEQLMQGTCSEIATWNQMKPPKENAMATAKWSKVNEALDELWDFLNSHKGEILNYMNSRALPPGQPRTLFAECSEQFFTNLPAAQEHGSWLDCTPQNFAWFNPEIQSCKFYIRESYRQIYGDLDIGGKFNKRCLITGTPGIGKSIFLVFLLWKLIKEKKRVFYCRGSTRFYYDPNGKCWKYASIPDCLQRDPANDSHPFWSMSLYCLYDLQEKDDNLRAVPYQDCQTICCSSPKRGAIDDFEKPLRQANIFYMPIWTLAEMRALAQEYPSSNDWTTVFDILGGIPRRVFEKRSSEEEARSSLYSGVRSCDLDRIQTMVGPEKLVAEIRSGDLVHCVVHIHSEYPFHKAHLEFASYVAIYYLCEYHIQKVESQWNALTTSKVGGHLMGKLLGGCLEYRAIDILERGGTFECCRLMPRGKRITQEPLVIQRSYHRFAKKPLSDQPDNVLYIPTDNNFVGMDVWIRGVGGFQITRNLQHDLKIKVKPHLANLGQGGAHKLYWVLREEEFDSFSWKTPKREENDEIYAELQQFVIKIPDKEFSTRRKLFDDWLAINERR